METIYSFPLQIILYYSGAAMLILGICMAFIRKNKLWHIMTGFGAAAYAAGIILFVCVLMFFGSTTLTSLTDYLFGGDYQYNHSDNHEYDYYDPFNDMFDSQDYYNYGYDDYFDYYDYDYYYDDYSDHYDYNYNSSEMMAEYDAISYDEYNVGDSWEVYMALNISDKYIDLYDSYSGDFMCTIFYGDYTNSNISDYSNWDFIDINDYNNDGYNDIGVIMDDGNIVRFLYDSEFDYFFDESLF